MLTEEINRIDEIRKILIEYWPAGCGLIEGPVARRDAAAAIAKRLSEGVVWSEQGRADISLFKPDVGTEWEPYTFVECDGATLEVQGRIVEEDGQLVEVTVKIVEGTKDE